MAKLTREQVRKGLEQVPMQQILQGATGTVPNLTNKQIEFAKELALGKSTKADAYRKVYNSKGNPKTVGSHASRLSTDDRIAAAVDAFRVAEQYREYQTPSQLRALVVSQLTKHILDDDFPPAQRVQCLKLLGGVAEVGLFLDRKESVVIHKSDDIKARLLDQLKTITGTVEDVTPNDDADSLLDEINDAKRSEADPTQYPPPDIDDSDVCAPIHTIPLKQTTEESIPLKVSTEISNETYPDTLINKGETL